MFEANNAISSPLPMIIPETCSNENMTVIITRIKDLINCSIKNTSLNEDFKESY